MTKNSKLMMVAAGIVIGCSVVIGGAIAWSRHAARVEEGRQFAAARDLINRGRAAEALPVIWEHTQATGPKSRMISLWRAMEIDALSATGNGPRLMAIYDREPKRFANQEAAVLQIGRALLNVPNFEAFDQLRGAWTSRETSASAWFELDVDALLARGRRDEATALLKSRTFPGAADCGRLARLAQVNTPGDLKAAWEFLDQAAKLDPRNAEVRLFRGQILERAGKRGLAHTEYYAAYSANTNNAYFRDQLGEFFRRAGNYDLAVLTWADGLTNAACTDLIWLRTVFWGKVARPAKFDWTAVKPPFGPVQPFVQYLIGLPPGAFWDAAAFEKVPGAKRYEQQLQETFWLRLLAALQAGKEDDAMRLLAANRFRAKSWHLDLESALLRVLNYRKTGELKFPERASLALNDAPPKTRHQLLEQLDALTKNPGQKPADDLDRLLRGKNAFACVCLAAGWAEAALTLPHDEVLPEGLPEWVVYGFTQATRFNRGNRAALDFAAKQKPSPMVELLTCDLLLAEEQFDKALQKLSPLATTDSETGARAARLTAETYLRLKRYTEARVAVEALPRFRQSTAGQELLAQIALAQNKTAEAEKIYAGIEGDSDEAKGFLAKQAFDQRNWLRARRLTEELARKYPERPQFRANLEAIAKAETAQ